LIVLLNGKINGNPTATAIGETKQSNK